jgi:inactivated superfamily I helicase
MQQTLHLFSNARRIRKEIEQKKQLPSGAIPTYQTIHEFLKTAVFFKDRVRIDKLSKKLLLYKASKFDKFQKLHFPTHLLEFIKHSSFLSSFIDEVSLESVSIESLLEYDYYEDYQDHIHLFALFMERYEQLLDAHQLIDMINIQKYQHLNTNYLKNYEQIFLHLDGAINNYELDLYSQIAKVVPLSIVFTPTKYNHKTTTRLELIIDKKLPTDTECFIDLSKKSFISKSIDTHLVDITITPCSYKLEQIGFIKQKIAEFAKSGIKPQDIVVVVPDERFVSYIKLFDTKNNLNLAMGHSFTQTNLYKELNFLLKEESSEQRYRDLFEKRVSIVGHKSYKFLSQSGNLIRSYDEFLSLFAPLQELCPSDEQRDIYQEALHRFKVIFQLQSSMEVGLILHLLLQELAELSIDDSKGGKVTLLGVLETRGMCYDGVIVVDFSDDLVPKRVQKDLFLPDFMRTNSDLPTSKQREALQKNYYYQLLRDAKKVAITYVQNEQTLLSKLALEIEGITQQIQKYELTQSLFSLNEKEELSCEVDNVEYDFLAEKLSATKLKTYLSCQRKFYYRYIKQLDEPQKITPSLDPAKIGSLLHQMLFEIYTKTANFDIYKLPLYLSHSFAKAKKSCDTKSAFELSLWEKKMEAFCQKEMQRYAQGFRFYEAEVPLQASFEGFVLHGNVDRIDTKDGKLYILDYKSGDTKYSIKKDEDAVVDFQLTFYEILARTKGEVVSSGYYQLATSQISLMSNAEQMELLLAKKLRNLQQSKQTFGKTNDLKVCAYCAYQILCDRKG